MVTTEWCNWKLCSTQRVIELRTAGFLCVDGWLRKLPSRVVVILGAAVFIGVMTAASRPIE